MAGWNVTRMAKSRRKRYKTRKVDVDLEELQNIVEATPNRVLSAEEYSKLQQGFQLFTDLVTPDLQTENASALLDSEGSGNSSDEESESKPKARTRRGGRKGRDAFKGARIVSVSHTEYRTGDPCPCGCGGKLYPTKRVGHFRHFVGHAPITVTLYERELLKSNLCDKVFEAPLPDGVGPEPYDATAVSTIALNKYGAGLPFYRQSKLLEVMGTPIAPSTQYMIVAQALPKLKPAYDYLVYLAAQGKLAFVDDTSMRILDYVRPEGDERTGIFTTGVVSAHDGFEIALFFTGRDHAGENRAKLVKNRQPDLPAMIVMTDALQANFVEFDDEKSLMANCLVHGRRNFIKIIDSFPADCQRLLEDLGTIYHHDAESKKLGHDDHERLAYHQQHSGPVMAALKKWLDEQITQKKVEPNSRLGKAIAYMRSHWTAMTLFLRAPGAPLDNNSAERVLKGVVLHRKNSLFYRTASGAKTGDIYMSLIQTCRSNDINPWDYLTEIQRHHEAAKEAPHEWMPWTYRATLEKEASPAAKPPPVEAAPESITV